MSTISKCGHASIVINRRVEQVVLLELLELLKALVLRLKLGFATLDLNNQGLELNLIVDEGKLLGCVFFLSEEEILLFGDRILLGLFLFVLLNGLLLRSFFLDLVKIIRILLILL